MQRLDYREPEAIGEVRLANLVGPTARNAWLTATGRTGHNRAMVWIHWDATVSGGLATFWAGTKSPFLPGKVVFGALPGSHALAVEVAPSASSGGMTGNALCIATPLSISPGADVGVMLSALTSGTSFADRVATVWWTSWIEAE